VFTPILALEQVCRARHLLGLEDALLAGRRTRCARHVSSRGGWVNWLMVGCVGGGHNGHESELYAKTANIAVAAQGGFIDAQELCCVFWTSVSDMHSEEAR
jgi:hypothetical protein